MLAGALFGAVGVLLGAFGAHSLEDSLGARQLSSWETAVQYQLIHALALLAVGILKEQPVLAQSRSLKLAGWGFLTGILLFSGSLYVLALGGPSLLGPITPVGGIAFITGWLALAVAATGVR